MRFFNGCKTTTPTFTIPIYTVTRNTFELNKPGLYGQTLSWKQSYDYAIARGGRLATEQEAKEYVLKYGVIDNFNLHIAIGDPKRHDFYDAGYRHRGGHITNGWPYFKNGIHDWYENTSSDIDIRKSHLMIKCDNHIELIRPGRLGWKGG